MKKWLIIALVYLILSLIFGFFKVFAWCLVGILGISFVASLIWCAIGAWHIMNSDNYNITDWMLGRRR